MMTTELACSSFETTKTQETHTTNFIDYAEPIQDGAKIIDNNPILIGVYLNGEVVYQEYKILNGMAILPPNRYRLLISEEFAVSKLLAAHPELNSEFNTLQNEGWTKN